MVSPAHPNRASAPVALTVAGSDSGGHAGIQADMLTIAANQVYATSAITCITAQNPDGVSSIQPADPELVSDQLNQLAAYYDIRAAKTGMLFNHSIIETVARFFRERESIELVVDPVMIASSGQSLLEEDTISLLKETLLPRAGVITPNLDEAEILVGGDIDTPLEMEEAGRELADHYHCAALLKGGHLEGNSLVDIVCLPDGSVHSFAQERILNIDTHGSGCTLSAAIAAQLARQEEPLSAITLALNYLRKAMTQAVSLPQGRFINHFPK